MPKGKKICGNCKAETGPRTKVCRCGFTFTSKSVVKTDPTPVKKQVESSGVIYTPSGKCPIKFTNPQDWVNKMLNHEIGRGVIYKKYSPQAILYFIEQFFPIFIKGKKNEEYTRIYKQISTLLKV